MGDTYVRPASLDEALDHLATGEMRIAAGCTDLFPATEARVLPGPVLDVTAIPDLCGISEQGDLIRLGATTTWTDVVRADLPPAFDGLKLAAREVGALQIQNRGTLGGNLCNASPAADGVPPLLTLNALVELRSVRGPRVMPLSLFLRGPRSTAREADELVTALLIPNVRGRGHFLKLGARKHLVISIAMVAARILARDGLVAEAAVAVGACSPVARRLSALEATLVGQPIDAVQVDRDLVAEALAPIDDVRADAPYRHDGAATLVARVLDQLTRAPVAA